MIQYYDAQIYFQVGNSYLVTSWRNITEFVKYLEIAVEISFWVLCK